MAMITHSPHENEQALCTTRAISGRRLNITLNYLPWFRGWGQAARN